MSSVRRALSRPKHVVRERALALGAGACRLTLLPFEYLKDLRALPHDLRVARENGGRRGVWLELRKHSLDRIYRRRSYLVLEHALDRLREVEPPTGVEIALRGTGLVALG